LEYKNKRFFILYQSIKIHVDEFNRFEKGVIMARKSVLTKEQIIECAFDLCVEEGISNSTIRNIAGRLKTSTAPIYTQYPNREMILNDLDKYIQAKLVESMKGPKTMDSFLDIGMGIVNFTLKYKRLVSEFYFTLNRLNFDFTNITVDLIDQMKSNQFLSLLDDERLEILLEDMKIYTFGLVAMICNNPKHTNDSSYYHKLLEQAGDKMIRFHLTDSGKMEICLQLIEEHKRKCKNKGRE